DGSRPARDGGADRDLGIWPANRRADRRPVARRPHHDQVRRIARARVWRFRAAAALPVALGDQFETLDSRMGKSIAEHLHFCYLRVTCVTSDCPRACLCLTSLSPAL